MKIATLCILVLTVAVFGFMPAAYSVETTVFGPQPYFRVSDTPDTYEDTFRAVPGYGIIVVRNGKNDGEKRIEDSVSSAFILVNGIQVFGPADFNQSTYLITAPIRLESENSLSLTLASKPDTYITIEISQDLLPPSVDFTATPQEIRPGEPVTLRWDSDLADTIVIEPEVGSVDPRGETIVFPVEDTIYTITATGLGGSTTMGIAVKTLMSGPIVSFSVEPPTLAPGETAVLQWVATGAETVLIDNGIGTVPPQGAIHVYPQQTTTYRLTAIGPSGSSGAETRITVVAYPDPQPEGSFGEQYQAQVPTDATLASYAPERFSMITGIVHDPENIPMADVTVSILGQPEYGTAHTDAAGRFSIPVQGDGNLTVTFIKEGYLESHRRVSVPWNDVVQTATVVMTESDPQYTVVSFDGNRQSIFRHRGSETSDQWGTRASTLVVTGDNQAFAVDSGGNDVYALETVTIRVTEYKTADSMPAQLPPNSAYTYCAEFAVDGVRSVRFEKPLTTWVDNFLGFDVGDIIPAGFYDREKGVWVPGRNGVVVMLLDLDQNGMVDALDADGDGQADDLNADGSCTDEVLGLDNAELHPPGSTFWRIPLQHFSPWDFNVPDGTPADAVFPNSSSVLTADRQRPGTEDCQRSSGSFVEERSRILHEDIPLPGTDLKLYYTSNRVDGYKTTISVPVSGKDLPSSLKRIIVRLEAAGNTQIKAFEPLPDLHTDFYWDGTDYLGQKLSTPIMAHVAVGFVYDAVFYRAGIFEPAFAQPGLEATDIPAREEIILWEQNELMVHPPLSKTSNDIAEGWSLSRHHHQSPQDMSLLHKGDGTTTAGNVRAISRITGYGWAGYNGTDKPALEATVNYPNDVDVDREGNVYFADTFNFCVRKVDTDGWITNVAGDRSPGFDGDGDPADAASFDQIFGIAVSDAGDIYIADTWNARIRKVDRDGIVTTIAGTGEHGYSGDNGPATLAALNSPQDIALDNLGNLYIADTRNQRIRKVDPGGIITTIAGNGTYGFSGDNGPAIQAALYGPVDVAVHDNGSLYIVDSGNHRIRRVDAQGIITTFAGDGRKGYGGDGGPADLASFNIPLSVEVDNSGNVYIADDGNNRIRMVSADGIVTTIAGDGIYDYGHPTTMPATRTSFRHPRGLAVDADSSLFIADQTNHYIRKLSHPASLSWAILEGSAVFAEEAGQGHVISNTGRHLKTIDLDSGNILYHFEYDDAGRLAAVRDAFDNQTRIIRDAYQRPVAIVSPHGTTTGLIVDEQNRLTAVVNPDGSRFVFEYDTQGLMVSKTEPAGNRFEHTFDENGRLLAAGDEIGGEWTYRYQLEDEGTTQVTVTTAEGNETRYRDTTASTGAYTSAISGPNGAETHFSRSADGLTVKKVLPCGTQYDLEYDLDGVYGYPFVRQYRETTSGGLEKTATYETAYLDSNNDKIPDIITRTSTLNDRVSLVVNDINQSLVSTISPSGRSLGVHYNPETLLAEKVVADGLFQTEYQYDEMGRLTTIFRGARQTAFTYNAQGYMASVSDAENRVTTYTYDSMGRPVLVQRPDGSTIGFAYDHNGNLQQLLTPSGIEHDFGYNAVNLKNSYHPPESGGYYYLYDADRRLSQAIFPSGKRLDYTYDADRLVQILTPDETIHLSYVCDSKIDEISDGATAITYDFDGKLLLSETLNGVLNASLGYHYNNDFLLDRVDYAGQTTDLGYDPDGLLTSCGPYTITRHDGSGLPVFVSGDSLSLSRHFNSYGEVDSEKTVFDNSTSYIWNLARDHNGRITTKTETVNGVTTVSEFTYDAVGRLLSVIENGTLTENYQYGSNGSRSSETNVHRKISDRQYAYSNEDHLLSAGETTYQYDPDGFLVGKTDARGLTQYAYTVRGELLEVHNPDGTLVEYLHDPLGRRTVKIVNGMTVEKYLWQGRTRLLAVFDSDDNVLVRFEYADGRMPLSMTLSGATYYLLYDAVGSPRVVADEQGNVVKEIKYDAFGNVITDSNPDFHLWFGFAGGLYDQDVNLIRFGHRDYDPQIGRWTAKDPIFFNGGDTDLYGYCLNDPVNGIDVDGMIVQAIIAGTVAGTINGSIDFITEYAKGASFSEATKSSLTTAVTSMVSVTLAASGFGAIYSGAAAAVINGSLQFLFNGSINTESALFSSLPPSIGGVLLGRGGLNGILLGSVTGIISGPSTVASNAFFASNLSPCE